MKDMHAAGEAGFPVLPRDYNATTDYIDRHLQEGRADKVAVVDDNGEYSYQALAERVNRAGNALRALGLRQETRVGMIMKDSVNFPAVFWGAIKAGLVPIPINAILTAEDYQYIISDSRMQALVASDAILADRDIYTVLGDREALPFLEHIIVDGESDSDYPSLDSLVEKASPELDAAPTSSDDIAFWLYSSGSTGAPKGVMHLHRHLRGTSDLFARQVLDIRENDRVFSAAKLYHAYGLGNGMTFPFAVGATAIYTAARPTPDTIMATLHKHQATIYCGVPTLFASILANEANNREAGSAALRVCTSAGEALPEEVGNRWEKRFGAAIIDGVGSTEMLHIFLSNRPGEIRYGTSGRPVPGYKARLVDEFGNDVPTGEVGELLVYGDTAAVGYWNRRDKSLNTFVGHWTYTGDKYWCDEDGYYHYCGRSDDMIKVSGNWVSPFEVESALIKHESVLEAAVIAHDNGDGLIKPKAYVELRSPDMEGSDELAAELKALVKSECPPWAYPRWIEFVEQLPRTATGKVQRFRLRDVDSAQ